jgi:hypothetical protein
MSRIDHIVQGAYKCNDCQKYRWLTVIPAIVDGVVEEVPESAYDGLECNSCKSRNCQMVFTTTDVNEASAYAATINALENE